MITKPHKEPAKKEKQTGFAYEHKCNNSQKNTFKPNPRKHQKDNPPWSSRFQPRDAGMVQRTQGYKSTPSYKQYKDKNHTMIIELSP